MAVECWNILGARFSTMAKNVLLIHGDKMPLPYYRIQIYNYLHDFLANRGYDFSVVSEGNPEAEPPPAGFPLQRLKLNLRALVRLVREHKPQACLLVIAHSQPYFFPFLLFLRLAGIKSITWTHGVDLQRKNSKFSYAAHYVEHTLCNGIVLYSDLLVEFIAKSHRRKVSIANNTLNLTGYDPRRADRKTVLAKYGIDTGKNIIFMGRVQKRKRIDDLLAAFELLGGETYGLVLAGPDDERILADLDTKGMKIFRIGPIYGNEALDLLSSCDVCCIPGAIGLSIVDAMYCGLPVVTERLEHGPEIMYLHEGQNGFMVEKGDCRALADRLGQLLEDDRLRLQFSRKAREEIETNGHIDNLCNGVLKSLDRLLGPQAR
jgi:glycosyltransferase involved in cell wall biosynthesis